MQLVRPARAHLPSFIAALQGGWTPDSLRGEQAARDELAALRLDPDDYLERQVDRQALGGPVTLPDGSTVPRLPGLRHWLWDGEFCGAIGLRWQPGTTDLPPYALGHIGYSVVPWKRRQGLATRALALWLPVARAEGLSHVELTTDPHNTASQRVILANGGVLVERFFRSREYGGSEALRFRIALTGPAPAQTAGA
jgi:predicted acetyltransferase